MSVNILDVWKKFIFLKMKVPILEARQVFSPLYEKCLFYHVKATHDEKCKPVGSILFPGNAKDSFWARTNATSLLNSLFNTFNKFSKIENSTILINPNIYHTERNISKILALAIIFIWNKFKTNINMLFSPWGIISQMN